MPKLGPLLDPLCGSLLAAVKPEAALLFCPNAWCPTKTASRADINKAMLATLKHSGCWQELLCLLHYKHRNGYFLFKPHQLLFLCCWLPSLPLFLALADR